MALSCMIRHATANDVVCIFASNPTSTNIKHNNVINCFGALFGDRSFHGIDVSDDDP